MNLLTKIKLLEKTHNNKKGGNVLKPKLILILSVVAMFALLSFTILPGCKLVSEPEVSEPEVEEVVPSEELEPEIYEPVLRTAKQEWLIGYTEGLAELDVSVTRKQSILDAAEESGVKVITADNAYPSIDAHISAAEIMVTREVDLVISSSWMEEINPQLMDIYNEAQIPVIGWDVEHPGAVSFYAIDTWTAGVLAGDFAAKYALEHYGDEAYNAHIVLMDEPEVGNYPRQKLWGFEAGIRQWLPAIPKDNVHIIPAGLFADDAQESLGAWLSANPEARPVLVTVINNYIAGGAAAALEIAGRVQDGIIVGHGADAPMFAEFSIPEDKTSFRASLSDSPWEDGYTLIAMAIDILEGNYVPPIVMKKHDVLTRENVRELVPEEYQSWPQ